MGCYISESLAATPLPDGVLKHREETSLRRLQPLTDMSSPQH